MINAGGSFPFRRGGPPAFSASLFKRAAAEYPAYAHKRLGAAVAAAMDEANAIASTKKSMELNPQNPSAAEQLKKLKAPGT